MCVLYGIKLYLNKANCKKHTENNKQTNKNKSVARSRKSTWERGLGILGWAVLPHYAWVGLLLPKFLRGKADYRSSPFGLRSFPSLWARGVAAASLGTLLSWTTRLRVDRARNHYLKGVKRTYFAKYTGYSNSRTLTDAHPIDTSP